MTKYFLVCVAALLFSSCGDHDSIVVSDGYNEEFRLKDDAAQAVFIERLKSSDLDYKVADNGAVRYHAKDRERLQQLAFDSAEELLLDEPQAHPEWNISRKRAEQIVSTKYPGILNSARMFGPTVVKVTSGMNGFVESGEEVWHIRIIRKKGGTKALFFVHPKSGRVYDLQPPDGEGSAKCE